MIKKRAVLVFATAMVMGICLTACEKTDNGVRDVSGQAEGVVEESRTEQIVIMGISWKCTSMMRA